MAFDPPSPAPQESEQRPRVALIKGIPMTSSLAVAEHFELLHKNVLQAIRFEIAAHADPAFTSEHFIEAVHYTERGRPVPIFRLTETGFSLIAMGFTGAKAKRWQRLYVQTFLQMRDHLLVEQARRERELQRLNAMDRASANFYRSEVLGLRQTIRESRLEHWQTQKAYAQASAEALMAQEIITDGFTGGSAALHVVELQRDLSACLVREAAAKQEYDSDIEAMRKHTSPPDPERYCSSEVFTRLLAATGFKAGNALVLWALLQERALDTPARIYRDPHPDNQRPQTVLEPRSVPMSAVLTRLGNTLGQESIYLAMSRMVERGLVVEVPEHSRSNRRPYRCYQLCLPRLIACLESIRPSPLFSISGSRTDVVWGNDARGEHRPLLLDECQDLVGENAVRQARRLRREDMLGDEDD